MTTATPVATPAVRFTLNGAPVAVLVPGGRRLLDVLRRDLGLTGTKEGCGEGECGACAVLIDGELANACLVPVGQVEGAGVRTVEDLAVHGRLGPLQAAFLELGGTQCGMCAPGMLMAATALLERDPTPRDATIREALAGTLCRCTGYAKIVDAVAAAAAAGPEAARAGTREVPPPLEPAIEPDAADAPGLEPAASLVDALARLAARPALLPVAGATDVLAAGTPRRPLLDLRGIPGLDRIDVVAGSLRIGALVTWEAVRRSRILGSVLPALADAATAFGGPAIRTRGTLGGSCVTASPAGDLAPILLAAGARLVVAGPAGERSVAADDFWTGYRRTALQQGELLVAIRIPLAEGRHIAFRKVGTRRAMSIAKVSLALAWTPRHDGSWSGVRVALGSVAERPVRARATEAFLEGAIPSPALAGAAAGVLRAEIHPIDDVRSTATYRRLAAGLVLRRLVLEGG